MQRKRFLKDMVLASSALVAAGSFPLAALAGAPARRRRFSHPGILHDSGDLKRIKDFVQRRRHPPVDSYDALEKLETASARYTVQGPFPYIARDGAHASTKVPVENDANAAYRNALMWAVTGEEQHAAVAVSILNAYAATLKGITGSNDNALTASLDGFILVNAAEILRYTYPGWEKADIARSEDMFRHVFVEGLRKSFFDRPAYTNGNWGAAAVKAMLGFGVYLNDGEVYRQGIDLYYSRGKDNGSVFNYIVNDTGQCQESGRDQQHVMLGLGNLAEASEVGYHQGDDLYGAMDNRLLTGYEYTAGYNLGEQVPFVQWKDVTGKYSHWTEISSKGRGVFRPIFEIAYNHYVVRKGLAMPWTGRVLEKTRPETLPPHADHPGFGTLLFYRGPVTGN